jgi:Mn-containing catalase
VKPAEQLALLQDFYRDRLALMNRHVEGAKIVADYEFNNTYQYIIAREEVHISWLRNAIEDFGGKVPTDIKAISVPTGGQHAVLEDDARQAQGFVDRWRERVEKVSNARNRTMMRVVLGEVLEHKRFFDQAKAGREDLLGRRLPGASTGDGVLPTRWIS